MKFSLKRFGSVTKYKEHTQPSAAELREVSEHNFSDSSSSNEEDDEDETDELYSLFDFLCLASLCRLAAASRFMWKLVLKDDAFSRAAQLGLHDRKMRSRFWMQLLKPDILSDIWSLGLTTISTIDTDGITEWHSLKRCQFLLDNEDCGYGMALPLNFFHQVQSMPHLRTSGRVRGAFASVRYTKKYHFQKKVFKYLLVHQDRQTCQGDTVFSPVQRCMTLRKRRPTPKKAKKKKRLKRQIIECASCGMWYISISGKSSRCRRCRQLHLPSADCCIYLSPAKSVLEYWRKSNETKGYATLVRIALDEDSRDDALIEAMSVIEVDVPRTVRARRGSEVAESLRRMLAAYAVFAPGIGYCQGMSYVAFRLLERFDNKEEIAFWALVSVLETRNLKAFYLPGLRRARIACYQLDKLTATFLPVVSKFIELKLGLPSVCYAIVWIQTLFAEGRALSESTVDRVWDALFAADSPAEARALLMRLMLALISRLEPHLAAVRDAEGALRLLQTFHGIPALDAHELLSSARHDFAQVNVSMLDDLERTFPEDDLSPVILTRRDSDTFSTDAHPNFDLSLASPSGKRSTPSSARRLPSYSYFDRAASAAYASISALKSPTASLRTRADPNAKTSTSWRWSSLYSTSTPQQDTADDNNNTTFTPNVSAARMTETAAIEEIEVSAIQDTQDDRPRWWSSPKSDATKQRHEHAFDEHGETPDTEDTFFYQHTQQQSPIAFAASHLRSEGQTTRTLNHNRSNAFFVERASV